MIRPSTEELWEDLHIKQGKSSEASQKAHEVLQEIDTQDFSDFSQAKDHGEYARISEVTGLAAAKKSKDWSEAREHLLRSLEVTLNNYPLAETEDLAKRKGNYWEKVFGEQSAQLICLRDVLHLSQVLAQIMSTEELEKFTAGLNELLIKLSDEMKGERFGLIFLAEEGEYSKAQVAYQRFVSEFGSQSESYDADQLITTASRFLGRAVEEKDFSQVGDCLNTLLLSLRREPRLRIFLIKELSKNLAKLYKDKFLSNRYESWSPEAKKDEELNQKINNLLRSTLVGLGEEKVEKIL